MSIACKSSLQKNGRVDSSRDRRRSLAGLGGVSRVVLESSSLQLPKSSSFVRYRAD
jgi:hypothetical protein